MSQTSTWSRLRWPVKALIIAVPILGLSYLGMQQGWFERKESTSIETTSTTTTSGDTKSTEKEESKSNAKVEKRIFAYQPEKPVDGKLKGVVEVGASGFNSFVIKMDAQKRWEIISKDFGESLVYEGLATTEDIRSGLKKYISSMFDKGVKSKDVHFVISSGAQKEPKTAIISSELKKMGFFVNLVTPEQEAKLGLAGLLPAQYKDNSFVTDIGSGNTKISWVDGSRIAAFEGPGAKYYEKEMKDDAVVSQIKAIAQKIPTGKRETCFIIGGVAFELAKTTRENDERYTVLNNPETYNADKQKVKSGLVIYKALKEVTGCDTFVFDWDANFTIGFLLGLPY